MKLTGICLWFLIRGTSLGQPLNVPWYGYGKDAQHTANSGTAAQSLTAVHWSTPVDLNKPDGELFIHYASPMVSAANTLLVPVKIWQNGTDGFKVQAFSPASTGTSPAPLYELPTSYTVPAHSWTPSFPATLSLRNRLYYAGPGGTVYYRDQIDSPTGASGQIAFYGNAEYLANQALYNSAVQISTPMLNDRYGNIYFGFTVSGANPKNLVSGIARISVTGVGAWVSAATAAADPSILAVPLNSAPVLSNDQRTLYFAVIDGSKNGYLASVSTVSNTTLPPTGRIRLIEPASHTLATIYTESSASPMVGPDGDVYFGVLETPCCASHNDRGWLLHFDSALTVTKTPGSFGWDTTPSLVPRNLVRSYNGSSSYLLLTKYNNYLNVGSGNGVNKVAVLDPNAGMPDPVTPSVTVMKEVMTVTGVTPDGTLPAVKEWCINTAAIDTVSKAAIINSEDGTVYRWDFVSGKLTQSLHLNSPIGEAYTPTVIGPNGIVYVINDAILYAIGH